MASIFWFPVQIGCNEPTPRYLEAYAVVSAFMFLRWQAKDMVIPVLTRGCFILVLVVIADSVGRAPNWFELDMSDTNGLRIKFKLLVCSQSHLGYGILYEVCRFGDLMFACGIRGVQRLLKELCKLDIVIGCAYHRFQPHRTPPHINAGANASEASTLRTPRACISFELHAREILQDSMLSLSACRAS